MSKTAKQTVFDRFMALSFMRPFQPFYLKHREALMYLLFGGLTTLINMVCFAALIAGPEMNPLAANVVAFIVAVIFAYVTNRIWVFESRNTGAGAVIKEMVTFFGGRLATLLMEEALLWIGIDVLNLHSMPVKIVAQTLVIITNYFISKRIVFN